MKFRFLFAVGAACLCASALRAETLPSAARKLSPIHWLSADSAPVLLIHGDADNAVGFDNARRFVEKADKLGADVPRADHGMKNAASPLKHVIWQVACERLAEMARQSLSETPSTNEKPKK